MTLEDTIQRYEALICRIGGVLHVKVVLDKNGDMDECHVLSDHSRSPKQLARDIQSSLAAMYGVDIDHKTISIAQIDQSGSGFTEPRAVIHLLRITNQQRNTEVLVGLTRQEKMYEGKAVGPCAEKLRLHLIAQATASALFDMYKKQFVFTVLDARTIEVTGHRIVMVMISYCGARRDELLVGTCMVREDEGTAVVRAVMDAVNRRLTLSPDD